jgi:hypothetical protein
MVKSGPNIWAISEIFKNKLLKVNNHPLGENYPNLEPILRFFNLQLKRQRCSRL